ncbi:MAG: HupE/UreJ family protein [Mycobacteriaceae bacterium]
MFRRWLFYTLATLLVLLAGLFFPATAEAHEPSATLINLSQTNTGITADIHVPLDRLTTALHLEPISDNNLDAQKGYLTQVFTDNIHISSLDGTFWEFSLNSVTLEKVDTVSNLLVQISALAPDEESSSSFNFQYEVITNIVYSHKVYVANASNATAEAQLLGLITHQQPTLTVVLGVEDSANAELSRTNFISMLHIGYSHFRAGADHMLFLFLLALGAVKNSPTVKYALRRLIGLTVAFTLGHSLSLALATIGWVTLPSRWVETAIAGTIVASAVFVSNPRLHPRGELVLTAVFGLIHGFGFAGTLTELSLHGMNLLSVLVGFNLGLEAAQILALCLLVIPVLAITRSKVMTNILLGVIATISVSWILQRAYGAENPLNALVENLALPPEKLTIVLAGLGIVALYLGKKSPAPIPTCSKQYVK